MADIFTISTYIIYSVIPAIAIMILLAFLQKHRKSGPCDSRPSLVIPMRFLDGFEDRWAYAFSFGAIAGIIVSVFMKTLINIDPENQTNQTANVSNTPACNFERISACPDIYVQTLLLQAQSLVASIVCAPHFACITTNHKLAGAICGFLYSSYWLVYYIVGVTRSEMYLDATLGTLLLMRDIPIMLCFLGLVFRSIWAFYRCYVTKIFVTEASDPLVLKHQVHHVQSLFLKMPPLESEDVLTFFQKLKLKFRPRPFPHFKLPARIICIAFVQLIIIYYIAATIIPTGVLLRRLVSSVLVDISDGDSLLRIFDGVWIVASIIGISSSVIYILLFVVNYRSNLIKIYEGQKHILFEEPGTPQNLVAQSLRLPGYQLAYVIWGFAIMFSVILLISSILSFGFYYLNKFDALEPFLTGLVQTLSIPVASVLLFYLQVLFARCFMMQPKICEEDTNPPLNIDNRRLYEVTTYVLLFSNLAVGLFSCLFRTLKTMIFGILFLGRLDRCLLMKGFESFDQGYMAYVGTLFVDNAHNNPCMRTFCAILRQLIGGEENRELNGIQYLPKSSSKYSNSRSIQRWQLAYTLLNNPQLLPRRKMALLLVREQELQEFDQYNPDIMQFRNSKKKRQSKVSNQDSFPASYEASVNGLQNKEDVHSVLKVKIFPSEGDENGKYDVGNKKKNYGSLDSIFPELRLKRELV